MSNIGSGLEAILNRGFLSYQEQKNTFCEIVKTCKLSSGKFQPRSEASDLELEDLADSIRSQGILQPILVRPLPDGRYEIIGGDRRWQAAKLVGLEEVPVIVKNISDQEACAIALIENIQRKNLNPLEEAEALQRLHVEFKLSHEAVAKVVGRSRAAVTNLLRLLILSDSAKTYLSQDKISMGHARAIIALDYDDQEKACGIILSNQLSVRETEKLVRNMMAGSMLHSRVKREPVYDSQLENWSKTIASRFNVNIAMKMRADGQCSMMIRAKSKEELRKMLNLLDNEH